MNNERTYDDVEAPTYEGTRLAYIKPMEVKEARALGILPSDIKLPDNVKLYAIHAADGSTIAIMDNYASAYGAALQNDFVPLSVH